MKIYICKDEDCAVSYAETSRRVLYAQGCGCGSDLKVATVEDVEKIRIARDVALQEQDDRTKYRLEHWNTGGLSYLLVGSTRVDKSLEGGYATKDGKIKVESFLDAHWLATYTSSQLTVSERGKDAADAADNLTRTLRSIRKALEETV